MKETYYTTCLHALDLIGVQLAVLFLRSKDVDWLSIFAHSYLKWNPAAGEDKLLTHLVSMSEKPQSQAMLLGDLFFSIGDVLTNDTSISKLILPMYHHAEELAVLSNEAELTESSYRQPYERFLKNFLAVMSPISVKSFNKTIARYLPDSKMIHSILSQVPDFDRQSKQLKIKPEILDRIRKAGINAHQIWYDSGLTATFSSRIAEKLESDVALPSQLPVGAYLSPQVHYSDSLLSFLLNLGVKINSLLQPEHFEQWGSGFASLLGVALAKQSEHIENKAEASVILGKLLTEVLLSESMLAIQNQAWELSKERILLAKNALSGAKSNEKDISGQKKSGNSSEEQHKAKIQQLFLKKKEKVMAKYDELKKIFMVGLEKNSEKIVQGLTESSSDRTCPITQEKLSNDKTYYQFCNSHLSNVSRI